MEVVHERCCGLDVHKRTVVACVLITRPDGAVERQVRTFKTMTADLLALNDWLSRLGVSHVALESTGVYWRPVFNILEDEQRTLLLVNPQHMRAVPGKKTDVRDSEWLADLLRHGLLRASFIPPAPIRAVQELTRYRKTLVQQRTDEANRLQKTLEGANLKLAMVASNVLGVSGRQMLEALLGGEQDPEVLADLARGALRAKLPQLRQALSGRVQPHHLVLIGQILGHIEFLEQAIAQVQAEIERCLPARQAERRRAAERARRPRQRLAAGEHGRGRLGQHPHQGQLLPCPVRAHRSAPGTREGGPGRRPQPAGRDLPRELSI